jgi:L-asparaginase
MTEAMREVASRGIPVVRASRVPEGRVLRAEAQTEAGIVTSEDLPPHKARVLLMLAILEPRSIADIQRIFDTH